MAIEAAIKTAAKVMKLRKRRFWLAWVGLPSAQHGILHTRQRGFAEIWLGYRFLPESKKLTSRRENMNV